MTDNTELKPEDPSSLKEGEGSVQSEILSDSERRAKYGSNSSRKATQSKREMMEALSRERFPWEE
ncbi:hypothetical protein [Polynucleobacter sp. AP-Latsch-80-C2]|uniref:hypothetical protein n=1 Tax=Polynucleobacter sp. AP-Latsch-80-C2 TaxID=2576931 RepID=UPI001C0E5C11|nr:hypothetical protein [Polynucleobacter sp. AP-Latsch-80-C2]MBU3624296.1 hypothetical protein [Polynucleobacter sp. AP-Latsch-80-C2]